MFKQGIVRTALSGSAADSYFKNVTGDYYGSDCSFVSTLRALVAPRLPQGEEISVSFGHSTFSAAVLEEATTSRAISLICSDMYCTNNHVYVHSIQSGSQASIDANFALLEKEFTRVYQGFHQLEKVTDFYRKSFKVLCFINPESKCTALFCDNLDLRKVHYLQCAILAILPWYFNPDDGVSDDEMALIQSLRKTTPDDYIACIEKIAAQYDFESGRIKQLLRGFETRYEKVEIERVRNEISRVDSYIEDLGRKYVEYNKQRDDYCIRLLGLETRVAQSSDEDSEIMKYFLCNKHLYLEDVISTTIKFAAMDYLTYFDEEAARKYIDNDHSYLYYYCGDSGGISREQLKRLLNAIFIEETLKIKFCAAYQFNLNGNVSALTSHDFAQYGVFGEYMPNPHIDRYHCMGNYESRINKLLSDRNYISALEQCIASAKSLNMHDSTVMQEFVKQLCGSGNKNIKCIELPDGTVVKPKAAIAWLEERDGAVCSSDEVNVTKPQEPEFDPFTDGTALTF